AQLFRGAARLARQVVAREQHARLIRVWALRMLHANLREQGLGRRPVVILEHVLQTDVERGRPLRACLGLIAVLPEAEARDGTERRACNEVPAVLAPPLAYAFQLFLFRQIFVHGSSDGVLALKRPDFRGRAPILAAPGPMTTA